MSGALPNLLRDLREAVKEQAKSKQELNTKLELQAKLQVRRANAAQRLHISRGLVNAYPPPLPLRHCLP